MAGDPDRPPRRAAGPGGPGVEATLVEIHRLQSDRLHRDARRQFWVEGVRNFVRLVDNRFDVARIVYSERLLTAPLARKLVRRLRRAGIATTAVSPEQYRQVSRADRASGIGAIASQRWSRLDDVSPAAGLCWVVLETVRSRGNLGTLIRTSEAIGGAGFLLLGRAIDPYHPTVVRATMGALFAQGLVRTGHAQLRRWVRHHGCRVIGASPAGEVELHRLRCTAPTLLLLGNERKGLTPEQHALCAQRVRIPMVGAADSLNLGVAGSLLMYEVYRARGG